MAPGAVVAGNKVSDGAGPTTDGGEANGRPTKKHGEGARWVWPADFVFRTPSRVHSQPIIWRREAFDRCLGVHYLTRAALTLGQPQVCIATAAVYFHRFYMREPLQVYSWKEMSATALFLAIKVEEVPRKLDYVVREFLKLDGMRDEEDGGAPISKTHLFRQFRQDVLYYEDVLLRALAFDLAVEHPYIALIRTVRYLHYPRDRDSGRNSTPSDSSSLPANKEMRQTAKMLSQSAWGFVNDSLSTPLCVIRTPGTIAAAAYLLALKYSQNRVPPDFGDDGTDETTCRPSLNGARAKGAPLPDGGSQEPKGKGNDVDGGSDVATTISAKDFATGVKSEASPRTSSNELLPPALSGRILAPGERIQWWEVFGATSLKDVNEAANIMLDQYARSAAQYVRSQALSIQRPPDPSPITDDPFPTTWVEAPSHVPPAPSEPEASQHHSQPTRHEYLPPAQPSSSQQQAQHSIYSPIPSRKRPLDEPSRNSPVQVSYSPMGDRGDAKRRRAANGPFSLPSTAAHPTYQPDNLPSPFLTHAADERERRTREALDQMRNPATGPSTPAPRPAANSATNAETSSIEAGRAAEEGREMKVQEEELRVENRNRKEEERLEQMRGQRDTKADVVLTTAPDLPRKRSELDSTQAPSALVGYGDSPLDARDRR